MNRRLALILLLGISLVIAVLLLTGVLPTLWAAILFAVALVTLGLLSRGFSRKK